MEEKSRLLLAILILLVTSGWAYFTVWVTIEALASLKVSNVIGAAGANGLLGSLVTLLTLTWQFYFRKASSKEK
jgi:outer membrane protein W